MKIIFSHKRSSSLSSIQSKFCCCEDVLSLPSTSSLQKNSNLKVQRHSHDVVVVVVSSIVTFDTNGQRPAAICKLFSDRIASLRSLPSCCRRFSIIYYVFCFILYEKDMLIFKRKLLTTDSLSKESIIRVQIEYQNKRHMVIKSI